MLRLESNSTGSLEDMTFENPSRGVTAHMGGLAWESRNLAGLGTGCGAICHYSKEGKSIGSIASKTPGWLLAPNDKPTFGSLS